MSGSGSGFGVSGLLNAGLNLPENLIFGTTQPLLLGPVQFTDFETPERINFGGSQKMTVHQLPGGERIIDAMGREEDNITWSGIFLGNGAIDRAKLLDVLRAQGNVLQLTWGTLSYSVVIKSFQPDYKFFAHIPYKITLEVLRDNAAPTPDNSPSPGDAVSNDVASAGDAAPGDAPQHAVTKTVAETSKGSTVTQSFSPANNLTQTSPTVANANINSGNNLPTSATSMVDLGPSSSLADATPASLTSQGIGVTPAIANAQASSDALAANPLATDNFGTSGVALSVFSP